MFPNAEVEVAAGRGRRLEISRRLEGEPRLGGGGEVGGSTDMAAWHPIADVPALTRVQLVDIGLAAVS